MTTYLKMLPSSFEYDDTIWWRVDDLWWSFLSAWSLPCFTNFASWAVHEHLVSYVALSSFSSLCDAIFLFFLLWILAFCLDLLLYSYLQKISGQHIPKEIYKMIQSKDSVIIELKVILYAITELVLTFLLA